MGETSDLREEAGNSNLLEMVFDLQRELQGK